MTVLITVTVVLHFTQKHSQVAVQNGTTIRNGVSTTTIITTTVNIPNATNIISASNFTTSGSVSIVQSKYASILSTYSPMYCRSDDCPQPNDYYAPLEIIVSMDGVYTITSNSSIDTYGYIYNTSFNPALPSENMLLSDDDGGGDHQFKLLLYLQSIIKYILVVTTFNENEQGGFIVVVTGPTLASFSAADMSNIPPMVQSNYSSRLGKQTPVYCQIDPCTAPQYHYEPILINVSISGYYIIQSSSTLNMTGYLYKTIFNPLYIEAYLLDTDDDNAGNNQFRFIVYLRSTSEYILVVTTQGQNAVGKYTVIVTGYRTVNFSDGYVVDNSTLIESDYSSALRFSNPTFCHREICPESRFYYKPINVSVALSGLYDIKSDSDIDTYGYIYEGSFNPLYPSENVLLSDDDTGGDNQFKLIIYLQPITIYILVVTTYKDNVTGAFSIITDGPETMIFDVG